MAFTLDDEEFSDLKAQESNYTPKKLNRQQSAADEEGSRMKAANLVIARQQADMTAEDRAIDNEYKKAQTLAIQAKLPESYKRKINPKKIVHRGLDGTIKDEGADGRQSQAFWDQSKPGTEAYGERTARAEKFAQEDKARYEKRDSLIKPVRDQAIAKKRIEDKKQLAIAQDPNRRLSEMRMSGVGRPGRLNYAEVTGADGQKASYTAPTVEGGRAYVVQQDARAAKMASRAAEQMQSSRPQSPIAPKFDASSAIDQQMGAQAAQAMGPMPQMSPSRKINPQLNPASTMVSGAQVPLMPQPAPVADPNASAAIASFNQTQQNITRPSSLAQNANLQKLKAGDNVPTVLNAPGQVAGQVATSAAAGVASAAKSVAGAIQNTRLMNPNAGRIKPVMPTFKSTTIGGSPIATRVNPSAATPAKAIVAPRLAAQRQTSGSNPLVN
jgi:hypothetical protein